MAAKRSAPALRRRFPARRGQVPQEAPLRARLRYVDGGNLMKRAQTDLEADPEGDLRDRVAALQKVFPERGPGDARG